MGNRLQPAVIGGLFIGVLSTLPFVSFVNCCCLWVIVGGALAAYLLQENSPEPITGADGALIGLMAGGIGAVVATILWIPVHTYFGPVMRDWIVANVVGNVPPEFQEGIDQAVQAFGQPVTAAGIVLQLLINLFAYVIFGMLGGVLGVALFRKKTG